MGDSSSVHPPAPGPWSGCEESTEQGQSDQDPVKPERGGVKRRGVIVGLLLVGLALGGILGGWIGAIVGGHQSDAAEVAGECYLEGCGFMVVGYAFLGIILVAILGAILGGLGGVWLNSRRR
jgi:hypothetical protein